MGSGVSRVLDLQSLRARFNALNQGHVFRFWDLLGEVEQEALLSQLKRIDLQALTSALEATRARETSAPPTLSPTPVERLPLAGGNSSRWQAAREHGERLLSEGRVAVVVVAGGQATRLGFPGPKGLFPIGPITERSLFELQAQKLRRLAVRYGRPLPWYVMTSPSTDAPIRAFFKQRDGFGLAEADIFCFEQAMLPSFDFEGRLMLATPGSLSENPDGHGGCLTALLASGALDDMEARGVTTLFYYQVDNPLIRMADPAYLGFHAEASAEMSCKVVRKAEPSEKMGTVARIGDSLGIVEYTELDDAQRFATDENGQLVYWAGSPAIHIFQTAFIRRIALEADRWLPYHASVKKIPTLDDAGRPLTPEEPNGHKLERFVFGALPAAERTAVVETARAVEYSPVKNAHGSDSPQTARRDLVASYRTWLEESGVPVPPDVRIEFDQSRIDGPDDVRALGIRDLSDAADWMHIEPENSGAPT